MKGQSLNQIEFLFFRALEKLGLEDFQDLDKTDIPDWVPHFVNQNITYRPLFGNAINPCVHTSEKAKQHCNVIDIDYFFFVYLFFY